MTFNLLIAPSGVWTCATSMHVISHFASFFQRSLGYFSDHVARKVLRILLAVNSLSFDVIYAHTVHKLKWLCFAIHVTYVSSCFNYSVIVNVILCNALLLFSHESTRVELTVCRLD